MANRQKKPRKVGRPQLPKGEAKGKIVPVRLEPDDLKLVTTAAKNADQNVSEWVRGILRSAAEVQLFDGTLHGAMKQVLLRRPNCTATTSEISEGIEQQRLYERRDGGAARAKQINARVRHYPALFKFVAPGVVRFIGDSDTKSGPT